jgi:hypothetical protein
MLQQMLRGAVTSFAKFFKEQDVEESVKDATHNQA